MKKKVLVVDDSAAFRQLEGEFLQRKGFDVVYAEDGAQAVKLAIAEVPDLILLDVQMPVMDGVQVLTLLKRNSTTKSIPIILVTTISREHDKDLLLRGGGDAVLSKPIQAQELWRTIQSLLPEEAGHTA